MKFTDSCNEKLTSCSWRHFQHDVNEKMANDSIAQKSKKQKNCCSTTGYAGANKYGPTHKTCDENTSSRPSKKSKEGMAGKSASNEGSKLLKFGSMLATSITELKDTMAGTCDQLEEILTQPDMSPWYPFIHLAGEEHCESKLSYPRTQENVPAQGSNPTTRSGEEPTNHQVTGYERSKN